MDDLDHSMHIAEHEWTSFYSEAEQCSLLHPLLACPEHWSLSDSEDSGNSGFSTGQVEPQQSAAENSAAGCCKQEVQINQRVSRAQQDDLAINVEEDSDRWATSDTCLKYPVIDKGGIYTRAAEHIAEVTNTTTILQTDQQNLQSPDGKTCQLEKEDGAVQAECDTSSKHEADPLSLSQREGSENEPHTTGGSVSSVALKPEKERWFVTVCDGPARQRVRVTPVKKKRRQKQPRKNNHMYQTPKQDDASENGFKLEQDTDYVTQSNQNSGGYRSVDKNPEKVPREGTSDLSQMSLTSGQGDNVPDKLLSKDRNNQDSFTAKAPSRSDSVESDEIGDEADFVFSRSSNSDSNLSAALSTKEPKHLLTANRQLQSSSSLAKDISLLSLTENTGDPKAGEMTSYHNTPFCNVTAANCEVDESVNVKHTRTVPSAAQHMNKMPDDDSTCDTDTDCTQFYMAPESPGLQTHGSNLSASVCSLGDQLSLPPVPDVTLTPCSAADSPETYVAAASQNRPVCAMSAFWDEMEKLTINDILQLRMGRNSPPRNMQKTVTPYDDDFSTNHSSLVDTGEYTDGGLIDTSDAADSDYFTQADESKPDRSSCEFSTSDFEEEYWQFLGTSRNPSPDPQGKNQPRTGDPPFLAHEEEESTASEGKETPVPSDNFDEECFEDQDPSAVISSNLVQPRLMTKSKSVRNVQALTKEDVLLPYSNESSLFVSSCLSLEDNALLKENDSLDAQMPAPFLSNAEAVEERIQISFPEVFEYFFTKDKAKPDSSSVIIYDPKDISVAPLLDYNLIPFRKEKSFSFLHYSQYSEEKPIPIFSYSHPTIRELAFPNVFLSADFKEEGGISPVRVVSRSFMHCSDYGMFAAVPHECDGLKRLLSIRKISFHDKGSVWCRESGAWVFPGEEEKITTKKEDPSIAVITEGWSSLNPPQLYRDLTAQPGILETMQTTSKSELSYLLDWMQ